MKSINPTQAELIELFRNKNSESFKIKFSTYPRVLTIMPFDGKFLLIKKVNNILGESSVELSLGQILALESGYKSFTRLNWS